MSLRGLLLKDRSSIGTENINPTSQLSDRRCVGETVSGGEPRYRQDPGLKVTFCGEAEDSREFFLGTKLGVQKAYYRYWDMKREVRH